mgnify:CR=1 FL=1
MESPLDPVTRPQATLVDLLDRVLDRGLVINADIVISLAGVPLVGISLRAAIAGMETMTRYGVMADWDDAIRARERLSREAVSPATGPVGPSHLPSQKDANGQSHRY